MEKNIKIDFIGVGAPKCGTTWIYQCLDEHPEICMGKPKEIHYFNKYHGFENPKKGRDYDKKGLSEYFKHFTHCPSKSIIGEYSAKYLYDIKAAQIIKTNFPNVKIIICLRNPSERSYSIYNHVISKHPDLFASFEDALKKEKDIKEWSRYYRYVKNYFDLFPAENILIVIYEDMKKNPIKFIQKIYKFIGVDKDYIPKTAEIKLNTAKARHSKMNKTAMGMIYKTYPLLKKVPIIKNILKYFKNSGINVKIKKIINKLTIRNNRGEIKEGTKKYLNDFFQDDIKKLEKLLRYEIEQWKK